MIFSLLDKIQQISVEESPLRFVVAIAVVVVVVLGGWVEVVWGIGDRSWSGEWARRPGNVRVIIAEV